MAAEKAHALAALKRIVDPDTGRDVVTSGMVADVSVDDATGAVRVVMEVDPARGPRLQPLADAAKSALEAMPAIPSATVILTAQAAPPPDLRGPASGGPASGGPASGGRAGPGAQPLRPAPTRGGPIEGVDRIVAIGSGKGGVGKSTLSANLAVALAQQGKRVGLLDADVYGPSQPRMLGVTGRPASEDGQTITPLKGHGVTLMSMGLMTDDAVVWRGPILMRAVEQMLRQVAWGRLDLLIVDLPPGTGDVQLTLAQRAELTGAVVVSTPQDVALLDAKKAIDMFRKTDVPLLGMIENMSTFCCPNCGHETPLFGKGGAEAEAARIGAPFLGALPLELDTRLSGDAGTPIAASAPKSAQAERIREIASRLFEAAVAR